MAQQNDLIHNLTSYSLGNESGESFFRRLICPGLSFSARAARYRPNHDLLYSIKLL